MSDPPKKIVYCYTILQPKLEKIAEEIPSVQLHEGFDSSLYEGHDGSYSLFLVIDDHMTSDKHHLISDLFTKYSRHRNISVAYLTQNAFDRSTPSASKHNRTLLINANEMVIFR